MTDENGNQTDFQTDAIGNVTYTVDAASNVRRRREHTRHFWLGL
jgi:hypothetical protein